MHSEFYHIEYQSGWAQPNSLGRLVVDFSPINTLLESPANVIPEVTATLQFLQGKGMFTSIDLRYAFLALNPLVPIDTFFIRF